MTNMNDKIKLAKLMGWTVEKQDRIYDSKSTMPNGRYGHLPHMSVGVLLPDPFTDANDDYAVLEWMRKTHELDSDNYELSYMWNYEIGDHARAALKMEALK